MRLNTRDRPAPLRVRLDAETAAALRRLCDREGCNPSEAVRRAIRTCDARERALLLEILAVVRARPTAGARAGAAEAPREAEQPSGPIAGILTWSHRLDEED